MQRLRGGEICAEWSPIEEGASGLKLVEPGGSAKPSCRLVTDMIDGIVSDESTAW